MQHSIVTPDGIRLHAEEAGRGTPIVFVHEYAADHRSWEPQMRFFARRHRCVTYSARGYPPSDVPDDVEHYSQALAVADILAVMDGLGIARAHVVGLSMGGFATVHFGLSHPGRALSLLAAGTGFGAEKRHEAAFRTQAEQVARNFETLGARAFAPVYGLAASRVQFQNKDPRGSAEFIEHLAQHSDTGSALTMRGVQARRPSLYDLEAELSRMTVPTLVVAGDEDDQCLLPGLFLKRTVPACGLAILPKTGHTLNLEEPEAFNRLLAEFIAQVEAGAWLPRDPRANPAEAMRTE